MKYYPRMGVLKCKEAKWKESIELFDEYFNL